MYSLIYKIQLLFLMKLVCTTVFFFKWVELYYWGYGFSGTYIFLLQNWLSFSWEVLSLSAGGDALVFCLYRLLGLGNILALVESVKSS